MLYHRLSFEGSYGFYICETTRHLSTRVTEHLSTDKTSHVFKHLQIFQQCSVMLLILII